ncbi:NAD-dependent epimerase/dehydratase family protein [Actinokineospora sp.]|uniref:NAD-dependent epimerase/dehydratase family protein n=1 Tax=Actinokineospora sp. TaxID=1872133 RepID=UPI004037FC6B
MAGPQSPRQVTVLGSSGLLGTAVARQLASQRIRLRLVGRRPTAVPPSALADVEVRTVDLTTPGAVADAVAGSAAVVHLISHNAGPGTWRVSTSDTMAERVNLGLVRDVVDAIRAQRPERPPVVLFAGSISQSAAHAGNDTDAEEALTVYDRHKLGAERVLTEATAEGLVRASSLRLATLYSRGTDDPELDRGVVAAMTRRAFADQELTMWGDGSAKRDLLCVDDAARAFAAALDHVDVVAGRHWAVGSGLQTSVRDLFTMIAKVVATQTGRAPVPVTSTVPADYAVPTDLLDFGVDPAQFQQATDWCARVPLLDGLENLAAVVARGATA